MVKYRCFCINVVNYKLYFPCQVLQKAGEAGWGDMLAETPRCRLYCVFKLIQHLFWGVLPWRIWEEKRPKMKLHLEKGRGKNFPCIFCFYQHYTSRCHTPWGTNTGHIDCWHQPSPCTNTIWKSASPRVMHEAWLLGFQSNKTELPKRKNTLPCSPHQFLLLSKTSPSIHCWQGSLRRIPALHHQTDPPTGEVGTTASTSHTQTRVCRVTSEHPGTGRCLPATPQMGGRPH